MTKSLPHPLIAGLALIVCLIIAALIRSSDYDSVTAARNIEASYHVLLTSRALEENPASDHFYLPTVTLGGEANAHVPWGATVATQSGDYVYASFAPPAFLVIHALDRLHPGPLDLHDLAWINTGLGALQALLLALLAYQVARFLKADRRTAALSVVFAVLIAIFSREALQSYGVVYWAHSSYQIVLIVSLQLSFALLRSDGQGGALLRGALLLCTFVGAWMEWTGYVFGGGLAVVLFVLNRIEGRRSRYPFAIAGTLALAGLVTIGHYAIAIGLENTLRAFFGRFFARSIGHSEGLGALGEGYILSYGLFLAAVGLAAATVFQRDGTAVDYRLQDAAVLEQPQP